MPPLVSVIVPRFNPGDSFREAVASVLVQTLSDIEVIAIDDTSAEDTGEVLEDIDDSRLTFVPHPLKRGVTKTLNEGIRRATGTYIAILNAYDRYHPERFEYCHEIAETNEAMLLGTGLELIAEDEGGLPPGTLSWLGEYERLKAEHLDSEDLVTTLIAGNLFVTTSNFFCHRSLFDSLGPLSEPHPMDGYDFLLRTLAAYPEKVHWVKHKLLFYRPQEEESTTPHESLQILSRWMPHLATGHRAHERLRAFSNRVLEVTAKIERESTPELQSQRQADVESYQQVIRDTEAQLQTLQGRVDRERSTAGEG